MRGLCFSQNASSCMSSSDVDICLAERSDRVNMFVDDIVDVSAEVMNCVERVARVIEDIGAIMHRMDVH